VFCRKVNGESGAQQSGDGHGSKERKGPPVGEVPDEDSDLLRTDSELDTDGIGGCVGPFWSQFGGLQDVNGNMKK